MKTLYILRHAKSSWKDETLPDFERPLNRRGQRAAETLGHYFRENEIVPDLILASPAFRARETIEIIIKTAKWRTELRYDERIYEASAMRLFEVVSQIENDHKTVLLVGHNPGLEELLQLLTGNIEQMPTGGLAKVALKAAKWGNALQKKASLESFVKPRELERV
ncbi:MAG TPA: histidine phosphatase family protein [Pyrinomonadaceae bacterium]